jgi:uncharacterized repeat protein (TIGR02543 family)
VLGYVYFEEDSFMKKSLYFGLVALAVVMSLAVTACKDEDDPAPTTYTVTFNTGDGGPTVNSATVNAGAKVTKPADPEKTNYDFGGWYKESALTTLWVFDTDTVKANTTLYAKWTEKLTNVNYTLPTDNTNPAGLSVGSAKKNEVTGITTIVLSGAVTTGIPAGLTSVFNADQFTAEGIPEKYSAITIAELEFGTTSTTIKQTNSSLILYKNAPGYNEPDWTGDDGTGVPIIVTGSTHTKTKTYNGDLTGEVFSILIADGVTPETAKLEITPAGEGSTYTVIIDWSNVTFSN